MLLCMKYDYLQRSKVSMMDLNKEKMYNYKMGKVTVIPLTGNVESAKNEKLDAENKKVSNQNTGTTATNVLEMIANFVLPFGYIFFMVVYFMVYTFK